MIIKHILAMKSAKGQILLFDREDEFIASFKDSQWLPYDVFEFDDLEYNFVHLENEKEILGLMEEARAALSQLPTVHPADVPASGAAVVQDSTKKAG
jgi:hypothetical protein